MSNMDDLGVAENYDIPRQHSRCFVRVYSHTTTNKFKGTIDCSTDVTQCETSKSVKGGGTAVFTLVPRQNYLNFIFPDDWVLIWFDPGDGRGPIKTFFGFVDRISRNTTVDANSGATRTIFTVNCSDMTKAFDKIMIMFLPNLTQEKEQWLHQFAGVKNISGSIMRSRGVAIWGSPADIVMNLSTVHFAHSGQFIVPPSFPQDPWLKARSRATRHSWVTQRLPQTIKNIVNFESRANYDALMDDIRQKTEAFTNQGTAERESLLAAKNKKTKSKGNSSAFSIFCDEHNINPSNDLSLRKFVTASVWKEYGVTLEEAESDEFNNALKVSQALLSDQTTLADLMDFSFIEYLAIDGSLLSAAIWQQQGSLWTLLNSYSHEMINELFVDLRPVTEIDQNQHLLNDNPFLVDYDYEFKTGINPFPDYKVVPSRVFVPAMIMREHPFGTVKTIDATDVIAMERPLKGIYIGDIFVQNPNKTGRHTINCSHVLHDLIDNRNDKLHVIKHLDSYSISEKDIVFEDIGRSDANIVNFFQVYADVAHGQSVKFFTQDYQPVASACSVARHGLRYRDHMTQFARFSKLLISESGAVDHEGVRLKLARWVFMLDNWYQHEHEYLTGQISTRAFPEIRCGSRLDIKERRESYYIESHAHKWSYPGFLNSSFSVTRGQRNDPFPIYVKPQFPKMDGIRDNLDLSRLNMYMPVKDPLATQRSVDYRGKDDQNSHPLTDPFYGGNFIDIPEFHQDTWASTNGYLVATGDERAGVHKGEWREQELRQVQEILDEERIIQYDDFVNKKISKEQIAKTYSSSGGSKK